jgi:N-acetylneuraminic acid mutarotase
MPLMLQPLLLLGAQLVPAVAASPITRGGPVDDFPVQLESHLVARLPEPATGIGAVAAGGWLYLLGGHTGEPHDYAADFQSREFLRLDLTDLRSFERLPGLGAGVQGAALVAHGGGVYRIGGMRALNAPLEAAELVSLDEFARFDVSAERWRDLAPLPGRRSSHAAAVAGSTLYVAGGWDIAGEMGRSSTFLGTLWKLDLADASAQWTSADCPIERRALGLAALDGHLVALGGMTPDGKASARVDVLELASGAWSLGPNLPEMGFGAACVASAGRVWASAGSGTVWSWAPGEERWRAEGRQVFGRIFHQLAACATGDLIAVGGVCSGVQVRAVEHLELQDGATTQQAAPREASAGAVADLPTTSRMKLAAPCAARNRQGAALVGDRLFLFGGNRGLAQHDFAPDNFLDESWSFDLRSLGWEPLADLPFQRQSLQVAPLGEDALLAVGGFGHDGSGTRAFADVLAYSPESDAWTARAALPIGRSQFALVPHGGALWMFGGWTALVGDDGEQEFQLALDVLRLDPTAGDAAAFEPSGAKLPRGRRAFGCALLDGKVWLVGGLTDEFERVEVCDVFDLEARTWSQAPAPRHARIGADLVALDGRLYLVGGSSEGPARGGSADRSIEVFDPAQNAWSLLTEDCGVEPEHIRAFAHSGRLLLVSTQHADPASIELAWIDPR